MRISARSISMPTCNSSRITPNSARNLMVSLSSTQPSSDGPSTRPATISPMTAGMPMRSASSAPTLAQGEDEQHVEQEFGHVHGPDGRQVRRRW